MSSFPSALVGHWVGDFLLQNEWMRRGKPWKSTRYRYAWAVLALHLLIAGSLPALLAGWWDWRMAASLAAHSLIDGFKLSHKWVQWFGQTNVQLNIDITDQVMHIASLWAIASTGGA